MLLRSIGPLDHWTIANAPCSRSLKKHAAQDSRGSLAYDFRNGIIRIDVESLIPITVNAAKVSTWGAELNAAWQPIRGLQLNAAGGWLNAKIESDLTSAGVPLRGNRPVNSPRFTFNGDVNYTTDVGSGYELAFDVNANWRASQFLETSNKPAIRENAYWLLNGTINFGPKDDKWRLGLWAKNITKTAYRVYTNDVYNLGWLLNVYNNPRTFGASLSVKY